MIIRDVTPNTVSEFFKNDPALAYLGLQDDLLIELYEHGTISYDNTVCKGLYVDNELICIVKYEAFTSTTFNVHFYINTKLQKNGIALEIQKFLKEWFNREYPWVQKVQTMVPAPCVHVLKSCEKFDMKLEGIMEKAIIWRKELVDMHVYGKYIGVQ